MAFLLFEKYRRFRLRLSEMKPHEKWVFIRDFVTFIYRLLFCAITDPGFHRKWSTWICFFVLMEVNVLVIYMLYANRHDFLNSAVNLYTCGSELGVSKRQQMGSNFKFIVLKINV